MRTLLIAINSKYVHTALGLRYVGEYAKGQGFDVHLIEETINTPILSVLEKIMEQKAEVYAFSVHIWNKPFVYRLISMLKKLRPEATIVVGGPEVAFDGERIFKELPAIDYIVQGEGEKVFADFLAGFGSGKVPLHIAYKKNGEVHLNGGVTVIEDLSILPFPYPDLEAVVDAHKIVYYECTRGCPFNCSYCLSAISRSVRKRPLEMVLRDMDTFMAAKVALVKFVDRTYNLDEKYFLPMMKYLAEADTNTTFHFEIKADILSEEVLDFLATVPKGRFQFEIGVQTTNPPTLKAINRQDNWDKLVHNCQRLLSFKNMHLHLDLIAGLPYEGLREFRKSFDDVYSLKPNMLQLGFLKVLPGTQMNKETELHGLRYMDEPPYEILATNYMPYEELQFLKRLESVFEQTYNTGNFPNILRHLIERKGQGAFAFYESLTNWWVGAGHYPQTHNAKGVAKILYDFILANYADEADALIEILRYDVFVGIAGWKPEWLRWNTEAIFDVVSDFWRDEEKVSQYIENYKFSSWRQIHKNYPIELFKNDISSGASREFYVMAKNFGEETSVFEVNL
ncbi:MAG: B12-binding domain-containing radical SAM protein [Phascolarctobacterium sp.]|nr:B12-binding domain-containing radical SAM protein [Phascolarctobacterium sp.]